MIFKIFVQELALNIFLVRQKHQSQYANYGFYGTNRKNNSSIKGFFIFFKHLFFTQVLKNDFFTVN